MWIFGKPIDELNGDDLRLLVSNRIRETTTLEFKRQMHGSQPEAIQEMLRDVSSMANAEGGIIVFGMDEDGDGVAKKLVPVSDAEKQGNRLVSSCLAGIGERIPGLRAVPVAYEDGAAIVVQIPRSHRRPHMVTYNGANDFWIRHDRQKSRMSVSEIRTAVTMTEDLASRVEQFIDARRRYWRAQSAATGPLLVLMATPLLLEDGRVDILDNRIANLFKSPPRFRQVAGAASFDSTAVAVPTIRGLRAWQPGVRSLELFRSGHLEFAVWGLERFAQLRREQPPVLWGWLVAEYLWIFACFIAEVRSICGILDPYIFTMSLYRCRNLHLFEYGQDRFGIGQPNGWHEDDELNVPSVLTAADEDADTISKRVADLLWNAFGFTRCAFFTSEGKLNLTAP